MTSASRAGRCRCRALALLALAALVGVPLLAVPARAALPAPASSSGREAAAGAPRSTRAGGLPRRSERESLASGLLPLPSVGDWAVFRVHEQARTSDVTLRVISVSAQGIELGFYTVGTRRWKESTLLFQPARWGWEGLPDLLLVLAGQRPLLPRVFFQLRREAGPAAIGSTPAAGEAEEQQDAGRPATAPAGEQEEAPPPYRIEAEWAGADPTLGGIPHHQHADLLVQPAARVGGLIQAVLEEKLGLPTTQLVGKTLVRRLRDGDRTTWPAETGRYRSR